MKAMFQMNYFSSGIKNQTSSNFAYQQHSAICFMPVMWILLFIVEAFAILLYNKALNMATSCHVLLFGQVGKNLKGS
ncbi:unnamed protein product [Arctia plantaginis]|uniref:Uncharacterized protein n=1 Tax=Arctia plantaginis TaxID=874455 RepID=A0A8S1AJQ0_ARCPL|nr:unnamed protein product [Arctia plantaginis]CAB3246552.1 unnamed protein product [Arctia plantaginis]